MDLGGRHIFLIGITLYFSYKTIGVWLARVVESAQVRRRLRKEKDRRDKEREKREKELQKTKDLSSQIDSVRKKIIDSGGDGNKGKGTASIEQLENLLTELNSEFSSINRKKVLINICNIVFFVLLIIALGGPYWLEIVGNISSIPGYSGSQADVANRIFELLVLGVIIVAIGLGISSIVSSDEGEGLSAIFMIIGGAMMAWGIWVFFCLWIHQLWNGSEDWWYVSAGLIITGWGRIQDIIPSENPP